MVIECLTGVSFTSAGAHRFCYNTETACSKEEGIDEYVISFEFSLLPTYEAAIQMFGVCMTTGQCKVSNCLSSVVAQEHCFTRAWETHYVPFPFWLLHWGGTSIIYCDSMVTPHIFIESQWDTAVHKILQKHLLSKSAGCSKFNTVVLGQFISGPNLRTDLWGLVWQWSVSDVQAVGVHFLLKLPVRSLPLRFCSRGGMQAWSPMTWRPAAITELCIQV